MKKFVGLAAAGVFAVFSPCLAPAQDAAEIIGKARNRIEADTTSTRSKMTVTSKNGSTTERVIDQYSKDGPNGDRLVIVFQKPAGVAGTRFLTMDAKGGGTDTWIYLPNLGKVRRIAGSEGSSSFMGTDMSYDDISSLNRDVGLDTYTLQGREKLDGRECYVVQGIPKDSSYQYSKMVSWVDVSNYCLYRIELYRKGTLVKRLEMSDYQDKQGRLTPMRTKMSTLTEGTSTLIDTEIVKYDDPIPEGVFSTRYLETGRP